jgi:DNA-binding GntR family transcriptional regulator
MNMPTTPAIAQAAGRTAGEAPGTPQLLAERAYTLLVRKITRLEAEPGSVLVERDLMQEFGIGRTPIREAMQRLASERLVNHRPNRGMFVSEITASSVQEIYEFRSVVDGHAAWLAATRATPSQVAELARLHKRLLRATEDEDIDDYVETDRHFYRVLGEAAHNALISDTIPRIFNLHLRLWFFISQKTGSWQPVAQAHEVMTLDLVKALERRDPAAARHSMESYIAGRLGDIKRVL